MLGHCTSDKTRQLTTANTSREMLNKLSINNGGHLVALSITELVLMAWCLFDSGDSWYSNQIIYLMWQ